MDDAKMLHSFVNDLWQFMKEFHDMRDADDMRWADATGKASAMCKKYNNHPAVLQTTVGYLEYLGVEGSGRDRKEHEERKKELTNGM